MSNLILGKFALENLYYSTLRDMNHTGMVWHVWNQACLFGKNLITLQ